MKKLIAFLFSILFCFLFIFGMKEYYANKIHDEYYDKAAEMLTDNKFKSLILQKEGVKSGDNLLMFGSSEFEVSRDYATHPYNFFNNKKAGFQVDLIGRAGYQSLVHAVDFGALGKELKNQKVVFVLSPQWFTKGGISENTFEANSSEYQVYGFLLNPSIDRKLKITLAKRILQISKKKSNKDFQIMRNYCELYSNDDLYNRALQYSMTPYYWIRYELLSIKDEINSDKLLKSNKKMSKYEKEIPKNINWNSELKNAVDNAKKRSHNKFGMDDSSYKNMTKKGLKNGSMKNSSYKVSPEYDDFKLLLDVCKEEGIRPLILNIPVNGKWYDYCGFNKADRKAYYNKINKIVKSYGFQVADFSNHEYDDYFLKDGSHLGWKGWIYVNKAIDQYYHEN
ncbi:D-alanyl-lipoteichoic acid biosynthesis protein DltD [Clostridiaceae bacterium UIB06]|uniref:Protein DltD n=1 Tax=Clostridium thailandense TaxID=2794346 RepID=A0A949X4B7_9CLOT|nr:D-alanyl-lipoteichoic acid biosynthesis protein DltD [Clostridium thailandense]MBV7273738.1 D-alanyl-lipoteichoic acid biosynthesis protein DltD [Clostridium thailandense]MCH5137482.1 D-alanyl-lipoteichoic acid biosynthesis protein DltD [Clostridiaceae bacterium UIB06]